MAPPVNDLNLDEEDLHPVVHRGSMRYSEADDKRELYAQRCQNLLRGLQLCTCNVLGGAGVGADMERGAVLCSTVQCSAIVCVIHLLTYLLM